jgi:hypothetical protein
MTTTTLSPKAVSEAIEPSVNAVLMATAYAQAMRERCDKIQRRLLASGRYGGDGEPKYTYLLPDEAAARYFADLDAAYREAGYTDLEPGHCPALIAESLQRDAERALIEAAEEFFPGVTLHKLLCAGLDKHREFLDLLIKLVVNRDGYRAPRL